MSAEQFFSELGYKLSLKMLQKMLDAHMITQDEFDKIERLNRSLFSPVLARIMR